MSFFRNKRIYLDYASGTPLSKKVVQNMRPYFSTYFHNPSALYQEGVHLTEIISQSRRSVAQELHAREQEIYFVDGATEANTMALVGAVEYWQQHNEGKKAHIITSVIEHASILETCADLEKKGDASVSYIAVDEHGYLDLKEFKKTLSDYPNAVIVSVGYVNGEIGTIQDIRGIMKIVRHHRKSQQSPYPYMHSDAVQAMNYVDEIGVPQLGIDLMTINASKIYGPKKSAVLFIKTGVALNRIIAGGNQEKGLRPGTENVSAIVGMDCSLRLAREIQSIEKSRLEKLQRYFISQLKASCDEIFINAEGTHTIPNIVNVTFPNLFHEEIVIRLDAQGIMCSVKSACKSGEEGDSHVIRAIAKGDRPTGSIRFSMGRETNKKDITRVVKELTGIVEGMNDVYKEYYKG